MLEVGEGAEGIAEPDDGLEPATWGGALAQGLAGWNWDCSRSWSVHLLGGAVRSLSGGMTSPVVEAGMSFRGGRPVAAAAGL